MSSEFIVKIQRIRKLFLYRYFLKVFLKCIFNLSCLVNKVRKAEGFKDLGVSQYCFGK